MDVFCPLSANNLDPEILQLLVQWGYGGIFLAALLAGSILPFSSELVLVTLVQMGVNPVIGVIVAALGNTLGTMTCYYMGYLGKDEWIEKYFRVKKERIDKMRHFLQGKGALMAFFTFLPMFGEIIAIALGYMRANKPLTITAMCIGKLIRYIVILLAAEGIINWVFPGGLLHILS